ncbi:MAG: FAD-dependent oxidoreductase [Sphingomonas sp.]|nr:FAD-dependent oxidoreductase [Sphingomonas sp.]
MTRKTVARLALIALFGAALAVFFLLDLGQYLTLDSLKESKAGLDRMVAERPLVYALGFALIYVAATAASFPGAAILTLAAGAIFGLWVGTLIVSFASATGATIAFLSSRYILRDWVEARFRKRVAAIDRGIEKGGAFYLLTLRLVPLFPFFLINLAMGLTRMRTAIYYSISQAGMLPGTIIYVLAGTQLARVRSLSDVLSPTILGSLLLLGIFPLIAKWIMGAIKRRRVYRGYSRPRRFDRNLIVIGAGAGGLVTAYIAATVRASVTLVEGGEMGGDCLNTGCVPSKALIRSARLAHEMRNAGQYGLNSEPSPVDFPKVMKRIQEAIATIAPADSVERYTALGVDVRIGHGRIVDPWTVEIKDCDGKLSRLTGRAIVIAAGGEPFVPDIPGLADSGYLTSETMWAELGRRKRAPKRLVIIGGGPIGTEMAQAFIRLGSQVVLVEGGERLLAKEDADVSALLAEILERDGVDVLTGHEAVRVKDKTLILRSGRKESVIAFDDIIVAVGRKARLGGYGLEDLAIETGKTIVLDNRLRTLLPNIYAVGDVTGPYQFTHFAAHQAWFAAVNALFGQLWAFRVDYSVIPWATFTDPEVAHVGHNEDSAREAGIAFEVARYDLFHLDRAVAEGARDGFVKLLTVPGKDKILGVTIVAAQAGEMLAEYVLAMKHGLGANKILGTIHAYPTMAEANKYAAGEWKKSHKPETALRWLEKYHRWRRG